MESADHQVDRTGWPAGPWDNEGDREEWKTAVGLPGLIARSRMGSWCGYVAVPPGHPYHGKDYDDVDVDVHWGLTYADSCSGHICHVPEPGEPDDVWWLGFDCAHVGDLVPSMEALRDRQALGLSTREAYGLPPDAYRTANYVRAEVERLAQQLAATG